MMKIAYYALHVHLRNKDVERSVLERVGQRIIWLAKVALEVSRDNK